MCWIRSVQAVGVFSSLVMYSSQDMSSSDARDLLQAKIGRLKESDSSLQRLRGKNADVYKEANEIRVCNYFLYFRIHSCVAKGKSKLVSISSYELYFYL